MSTMFQRSSLNSLNCEQKSPKMNWRGTIGCGFLITMVVNFWYFHEKARQTFPLPMYREENRTNTDVHQKSVSNESIPVYFYKKQLDLSNPFRKCDHKCHLIEGFSKAPDAVVVFHAPSLHDVKPLKKYPQQIWVLHSMEPPTLHPPSKKLEMWTKLFNWTLGYRRDVDLLHVYGKFRSVSTTLNHKNTVNTSIWRSQYNKTSLFVSHCGVASKRLQYVKTLNPFYKSDVYGACGTLKCPKSKYSICLDLIKKYKFYLAFENSFCKDYVTEKMFKTYFLNGSVIPIGRGQKQYDLFMPPNSFLDTSKYSSPMKLAEHLWYISTNASEANLKFAWKEHFEVYNSNSGRTSGFCELCRRLHDPALVQKYKRIYEDIDVWLRGRKSTRMCMDPSDLV